ncbi:MAG: helix-turn-helix domain-containing protein [Euryarchaeota archaeon]|nr:helix-turn-helix domain-containing protein [Euryarchaeota archaeon]
MSDLPVQNTLDLRYMQIEMNLLTGNVLPGSNLTDSFLNSEFVTLIEQTKSGLICYFKFEFNDISALDNDHGGLDILEIKSLTKHSALARVILNGPIAMMFCEDNEVWWVNPTYLNQTGLSLTIRGTRAGLTRIRENLSELVGNGYSVKLGAESMHSPEFRDMLPHKQRMVLDKAIEMGYYSRPRGCTQRDIAEVMNIKQATVSEHLQSAESKIINSIGN